MNEAENKERENSNQEACNQHNQDQQLKNTGKIC